MDLYKLDYREVESGAFKNVRIYDNYVLKYAKNNDDNCYKMSYSEARYNSAYYDSENNFHYSWVETEWGSNPETSDCEAELSREFEYVSRKKHLPIIVPILSGDETEYVMPRAKTFDDFETDNIPNQVFSRRRKHIQILLMGKIQKTGAKISYEQMSSRFRSFIKLGIAAKMSDEKIASNLFWFFMEDVFHDLLADMHYRNIGVYHGNLVTFDMGQIYEGRTANVRKQYTKQRQMQHICSTSSYKLEKR